MSSSAASMGKVTLDLDAGVNPILGYEAYIAPGHRTDRAAVADTVTGTRAVRGERTLLPVGGIRGEHHQAPGRIGKTGAGIGDAAGHGDRERIAAKVKTDA